jgi:hypothetical protein
MKKSVVKVCGRDVKEEWIEKGFRGERRVFLAKGDEMSELCKDEKERTCRSKGCVCVHT